MRFIVVALTFIVAGCVSTQVVSSNQNTVVVKASLKKPAEAQAMADAECAKSSKSAELNQFVPANKAWAHYFFTCEAK